MEVGWCVGRGGGVTRHGWHENSHKATNYMSDHNSYCWCYSSKTVITTAMLQSQQHLPTSATVTKAAGGITTATSTSPQQAVHINSKDLVCSQQLLLPSQQHYSRIAIATATSRHSHCHNSSWRPHNSNLRDPHEKLQTGMTFFF